MAEKFEVIITAVDKASDVIKGVGDVAKKALVVGLASAAAAATGLGIALASTIGPASDLNETISKTNVVFGDQADAVMNFAETSATALGMTKNEALTAAGTYGNLFRSMNMTEEASADMSTGLIGLAADLASFNNMDPTEVLEKFRAGLTGESEPLKSLGVNINQAMVEQRALQLGLIKSGEAVTASAKAQAVYSLILEQTSLAQGDFERTSGGLANQQRILKASLGDIRAEIGTALLPAITQIAQSMTTWLASPEAKAGIAQLVDGVSQLAAWLGNNLPIALAAASDFWTNVLQPALATVWGWMNTVLIPFLQTQVIPFLQTYIPIALQVLADFWTNILQPAISAVWTWMSTVLIPFLQTTVFPWLQKYIPAALQTLATFWNTILLPAIRVVWSFISTFLMPVLLAIGNLIGVLIVGYIGNLVNAFKTYLLPVLIDVWNWVDKNLLPVFASFFEWLGKITGGVQGIVTWIDNLTTKIANLIQGFSNIKIPDWLMPGSPTPFEMGLRGIASAMEDITSMGVPTLSASLSSGASSGISNSKTVIEKHYHLTIVSNSNSEDVISSFRLMESLS